MNVLPTLLWIIIGLFVLCYIIRKLTNTISVDKYEYLTIITFEWKDGRDIRSEMQRKMNGRISGPRFYQQMAELEDEELIVGETHERLVYGQTIRARRYRKKIGGNKKIPNKQTSNKSPSTELESVGV